MSEADIVARLAQHRTLGAAPHAELAWIAAHGSLRHIESGESVTRAHDLINALVIVLSGHIAIHVDRGAGRRKVMEWGAGDISGVLPYSRMVTPPGDAVIDEPGDVFQVPREHFPEMIRECPNVTATLVHVMLDRARRFTSSDLQDDKMISLGRLSAGLAHELNNPASAAARSARLLIDGLTNLENASRALGAAGLSSEQLETVHQARRTCSSSAQSMLSPIERSDREDALTDWLDARGAPTETAAALVDTALTLKDLDALASTLTGDALSITVEWLASDCYNRALAAEVEKASTRIHDLVAAIKRFTYMDRTAVPDAVDLAVGLSDSVALLMHKARKKSVAINLAFDPAPPHVRAIGSDLNQIWTNLIDNAIDAAPESGHVTISAARNLDSVIVRIVDDGPGVPQEIRERIFDPFFTTKAVGQGTGLGLDISRRLARRNDGDIEFDSRPGRTEFRVTLPATLEET